MLQMLRRAARAPRRRAARAVDGDAAVRRPPDSVRRCLSPDARSARSTSVPRRSTARRRSDCMDFSRTRGPTEYPLALISPASERTISSTLGELPRPAVRLDMHPDDAAARGIAGRRHGPDVQRAGRGATAGARDAAGAARARCRCPKGVWRRHISQRLTSNALVPDTLTDLGGGACFNDARVQIERV